MFRRVGSASVNDALELDESIKVKSSVPVGIQNDSSEGVNLDYHSLAVIGTQSPIFQVSGVFGGPYI